MTRNFFQSLAVRHPTLARTLRPYVLRPLVAALNAAHRIKHTLIHAPARRWHAGLYKLSRWKEHFIAAKDRLDLHVHAELSKRGWHALLRGYSLLARPRLFGLLLDDADGAAAGSRIGQLDPHAVLMLVVSDLRIDPRVEREARTLAAVGYSVHVVCPDFTLGQQPNLVIDWGPAVTIHLAHHEALRYVMRRPGYMGAELLDAARRIANRVKPFAIHAHDLNTCLVGLALARSIGAHFVADFHEWTSENVHWDDAAQGWAPYPSDWKAELQALEARVMREASAVITVSQSIVEELAAGLGAGRHATLIRNVPSLKAEPTREYRPLREELSLSDDKFLVLYQGGTGPTRLIEPLIEALAMAPDCVLAIRGPSLDQFGEGYRYIARRGGYEDRLVLLPPVPSRDVVAAARGADAGIYNVIGSGKSFIYALPNKIFEYCSAGLPVLSANYPEVKNFVEAERIGLTFPPQDTAAIAECMVALATNPGLADGFRENALRVGQAFEANEWQKLVTLYAALPRQ